MPITPKENYLMLLRGEIPEYVPAAYIESVANVIVEDQIAPTSCPNGPITTVYGVTYVGSPDLFNGALPKPGEILLDDITKWRDVIKNPDNSHRDWEGYYKKQLDTFDRENKIVRVHGGDYFLTLVSFMGFEGALIAMYQEPEEVYALFDYISQHYLEVMKMQIKYCKPEVYTIMDDDAAKAAPFFSLDMYRELVKPFHKRHADLALDNGIILDRHDCGHCEQFVDDWWELGIRSWNPAQISNDLVGIKKKYNSKIVLNGAWDNTGYLGSPKVDPDDLMAALEKYVSDFAPGGGFVYSAAVMGNFADPLTQQKSKLIADYYFAHVRDYYKTH